MFIPNGSNIGIQIYAEDSYRVYQRGMPIHRLAENAITTFTNSELKRNMIFDAEQFFSENNIIPAVIPREGNERMLQEIPHVPFEDLEIIFKFVVPLGMANVTNRSLQSLGLSEEEFFAHVMENPAYKDNITITGMSQVISQLSPGACEIAPVEEELMLVISNKSNCYGAGSILDKDTLQKITDILGNDIYILPSSVHECIAVPKGYKSLQELRDMVREINENTVEPEERLSNQVYEFDPVAKKLSIAGDSLDKDYSMMNLQNQRWDAQSR